jgi:hypothetical protein
MFQALARYTAGALGHGFGGRGVRLPPSDKADKCLSRVLEVWLEAARKRRKANRPLAEAERQTFERNFFNWLVRFMRSKEGRGLPYLIGGRAEIEAKLIERLLEDEEPTWGMDISRVATYLAEAELPSRKTAESLHHGFLAHEGRKSVGAVRQAASDLRKRAEKIQASEDRQRFLHPYYSNRPIDYGSPDADPMDGLAFTVVDPPSQSRK